jgi:hypothetical protein
MNSKCKHMKRVLYDKQELPKVKSKKLKKKM